MEFNEPFNSTVLDRGRFGGLFPAMPGRGELSIQVLKTPAERLLIAPLRKYADFSSEYELDPGMAALEQKKDSLGMVMAIFQDGVPIATIRFIPGGHGVTLTERFWGRLAAGTDILGPDNWEVGRLVMAPENRRADLLPRCMAMSLVELLDHADVQQFHASCLTRMTRLYRRFGFSTVGTSAAPSGWEAALIHGEVDAVARALKVNVPSEAAAAVLQ
jgi:predicted GNAT family N-acyltransferase